MDLIRPEFLFILLPLVFLIYLFTEARKRKYVLLFISLAVYIWFQRLNSVPVAILIVFNYIILSISHRQLLRDKPNRFSTFTMVLLNIGVFCFFKIYSTQNFIHNQLTGIIGEIPFAVVTPLGLSFILFQIMACYFDTDRKPESFPSSLADYVLYLMFFPKILMGPINRWPAFSKQLSQIQVNTDQIRTGIKRFIIGLAKKIIIANQLAVIANAGFNLPDPTFTTGLSWIIILCYFFQIYYDFSGYIDMVIGAGMIFGIQLPENFNQPYHSQSITEFWRRWHMTLTSWFRDYVFFPLEFSRRKIPALIQPMNIIIIFVLTGLWHGFNLNYLIWGTLQGCLIVVEATPFGKLLEKFPSLFRRLYVLLLVILSWVIFRAPGLRYALKFMKNMFIINTKPVPLPFYLSDPLPIINNSVYLILILCILFLLPLNVWSANLISLFKQKGWKSFSIPTIIVDILYIVLLVVSLTLSASQTFIPTVYQQF